MKKEYDFTKAEQGKFYTPLEKLDIPIYLNEENRSFLLKSIKPDSKNFSMNDLVNALLKKDIEISKKLAV